ncbi:hypothetical protein C942_02726 [Photobacterium marinum]|uniref:Uncharacterized protein n=1 Tax=Photobacterium marinum TaxID=1056511 RepID=L8JG33_9GAMM|nr:MULTISPECIES: YscO family type III secretion system apparatus protein [Photobacterium]ELR67218.1 hypothetical protein C942_02726 [Photobacterium marinum]
MWQTLIEIKDRRKQAALSTVNRAATELESAKTKLPELEQQLSLAEADYQTLATAPFSKQSLMSQHALELWRQKLGIAQQHIEACAHQLHQHQQHITELENKLNQCRIDYQHAQFKLEKSKEIKKLYETADIARQRQQEDNALDELPPRRPTANLDKEAFPS